jgi:hypothetical protein
MNSSCTRRFWHGYEKLPRHARLLADKMYLRWRDNPGHPSLNFERLAGGDGRRFSVRVGLHYRAVGRQVADGLEWVWIGSHEEFNQLF